MRMKTVKFLICKDCKESLEVYSIDEGDGINIWRGNLICRKCSRVYNIIDGVLFMDDEYFGIRD